MSAKPSAKLFTAERLGAGLAIGIGGLAAFGARTQNLFIGTQETVWVPSPTLGVLGVLLLVGGLMVLVAQETPRGRLKFCLALAGGAAALWLLTLIKTCLRADDPVCAGGYAMGACAPVPPCQPASVTVVLVLVLVTAAVFIYVRRQWRGVN